MYVLTVRPVTTIDVTRRKAGLRRTGRLPAAQPEYTERPASDETGRSDLVAGAGFEPTTSGL
jgi:hypothetical protein